MFKRDLDQHFYLISRGPREPTTQLLVTAHGSHRGDKTRPNIRVPHGVRLVFYGPHGFVLSDPGALEVMHGARKAYEIIEPGQLVTDYKLHKFKDDTYDSLEKEVDKKGAGMDVLTIRNRKWPMVTSNNVWLSDVLSTLQKHHLLAPGGYEFIHYSFCRAHEYYAPKSYISYAGWNNTSDPVEKKTDKSGQTIFRCVDRSWILEHSRVYKKQWRF